MSEQKPSISLPAVVDKIIESPDPAEPTKAQINIQEGADPLYKEIRIKNSLIDGNGNEITLKEGAEVEVTVEAQKPEDVRLPPKDSRPEHGRTDT